MNNINEINTRISELGNLIRVPQNKLYVIDRGGDDGRYHLEFHGDEYHYISVERGQEIDRFITKNIDELLYKIFEYITSNMAFSFELENRVPNQDSRRIAFSRQIELMSKINESWGDKIKRELDETLKNAPFDDFSGARAEYCRDLMSKGVSGEKAYEQGCKRFPLGVENYSNNSINYSDASFLKRIFRSIFN